MAGPVGTVKRFTLTAPGTPELVEEWRQVFLGAGGMTTDDFPEDTWEAAAVAWFNDQAPRYWNHFLTLLRQRVPCPQGGKWQVWKVAERQARGATHYQGSLRCACGQRHFIPMEVFRKCAVDAGFGPRVGLDALRDARQAVSYAGKAIAAAASQVSYHGKTLLAWAWRRQHVVTTTRDWCPTWERRPRSPGSLVWEFVKARLVGSAAAMPMRVREFDLNSGEVVDERVFDSWGSAREWLREVRPPGTERRYVGVEGATATSPGA